MLVMIGAQIIRWVDRQYDSPGGYKAKYALLLIAGSPWLLVLLLDKHIFVTALAGAWSIFWTALFLWRAGPWLRRLDKHWERRGRRR
jgi:hypothetical protein